MDAWQVDAFRDLGVAELSDLPVEPAPPAEPPEPGVVVLGRFQPVHKGHALMIQAAEVWRIENASEAVLIIAIGSSNQPPSIRNPWSSEERTAMLRVWLDSALTRREVPWWCRVYLHHRRRDCRALRVFRMARNNGRVGASRVI